MADIRRVTDDFAVAPQISAKDFATIASLGYRTIINNRPDGEMFGQLTSAEAEAAAKAAGLAYVHAPFAGQPPAGVIETMRRAISENQGPVLAYCRSGTRSITAWSLLQAQTGARGADELIGLAANAGYDLSPLKGLLLNPLPR